MRAFGHWSHHLGNEIPEAVRYAPGVQREQGYFDKRYNSVALSPSQAGQQLMQPQAGEPDTLS